MIDVALESYLDLIEKYAQVAMKKIKKPTEYSLDDLIDEGVIVFLYTKNEFEDRGASFKTILTIRLRNHLSTLVKNTYRNNANFGMRTRNELEEMFKDEGKKNGKKKTVKRIVAISKKDVMSVFEEVQMSFTLKSFNSDELFYIQTLLSFADIPKKGRRKATRKELRMSYENEIKIRKSIRSKINA